MTQSQRKSIEQLLKLTRQEWLAYLKTLPEAERRETREIILGAVTDRNLQALLEKFHNNVKRLHQ